jgi:hypothetical protein
MNQLRDTGNGRPVFLFWEAAMAQRPRLIHPFRSVKANPKATRLAGLRAVKFSAT